MNPTVTQDPRAFTARDTLLPTGSIKHVNDFIIKPVSSDTGIVRFSTGIEANKWYQIMLVLKGACRISLHGADNKDECYRIALDSSESSALTVSGKYTSIAGACIKYVYFKAPHQFIPGTSYITLKVGNPSTGALDLSTYVQYFQVNAYDYGAVRKLMLLSNGVGHEYAIFCNGTEISKARNVMSLGLAESIDGCFSLVEAYDTSTSIVVTVSPSNFRFGVDIPSSGIFDIVFMIDTLNTGTPSIPTATHLGEMTITKSGAPLLYYDVDIETLKIGYNRIRVYATGAVTALFTFGTTGNPIINLINSSTITAKKIIPIYQTMAVLGY